MGVELAVCIAIAQQRLHAKLRMIDLVVVANGQTVLM